MQLQKHTFVLGLIALVVLGILLWTFSSFIQRNANEHITQSNPTTETMPAAQTMEQINSLIEAGKKDEAKQVIHDNVANPATSPFDLYGYAITLFSEFGNREQAAFVFYLAQTRTRAYTQADPDPTGSAALRGALNDGVGPIINEWVFSDLTALKAVASKAIAFDKKLGAVPNVGFLDDAAWNALVETERAAYEADFVGYLSSVNEEEFNSQRTANGLYVGPWQAAGEPLPAAWQ